MCGRFCCSLDPSTLKCRLQKENVIQSAQIEWIGEEKHKSSYNVCPTRFVPVLFEKGENKEKLIQSMYWGFIPSWSKSTPLNKPINARFETLTEKNGSIFDRSKNSSRCIIAAEGFYEWNKKRQPFYVKRKDGQLLLFAGLYSTSVIEGVPMTTCVIITTASTVSFSKIHHRMPVILEPPQVDQWLDPSKPWNQSTIDTLSNAYQDELECYRVSENVGPTKNDSANLTVPLDENKNSISQFLKPVDKNAEINKIIQPALLPDNETLDAANKKRKKSSDDQQPSNAKTPKITNFFTKK